MSAPLLELRNIETYYGPIMAIRGVSMRVDEGEVVAVLGANGAGKTTLLKTATGALDSRKGRVLFDGREIQCLDPDRVARMGIAHVPEGREVFPFLTVDENLAMGNNEINMAPKTAPATLPSPPTTIMSNSFNDNSTSKTSGAR